MTVRIRRPEDLPGCVAALAAVHAADGYPMVWPADPIAWLRPADPSAAETDAPHAWVAEDGGVIVGHVALTDGIEDPLLSAATGRPAAELIGVVRLFVTPAARGRGYAIELLDTAMAAAHTSGKQLVLEVVEDGAAAIALYERLGWRLVGKRTATWQAPDATHPTCRLYAAP